MRVGIVQSNYIPWRGYFDLIDDVDVFILLDTVQYTVRDWRNRNKLKTRTGTSWISVSVHHESRDQLIQDVAIDWSVDWPRRHLDMLRENYRDAPCYGDVAEAFAGILARRPERLSALNRALLEFAAARLSITTPMLDAATLPARGRDTDRLVSLVAAVGGTSYLSGPSAEAYLDLEAFRAAGIAVEYKSYDYAPYPQLWGPFEGAVSILDLLMNTGREARNHIKSRTPNRRIA